MKFRCEDFDGCIDKILDNSASEDVRSAFFLHLSECENCCREYENAKFIKETLRDRSPKLGEDFTSSVMARISPLPEKKKTVIPFNRVMRVAAHIAACLLIVFAVVFSAFSLEQRQKSLGEYISRDVPDEAAQESSKQTTENESDYITENYIKYLTDGSEIPNYGTYSEQSVLDILSKTVDGYVNGEYGYICFMTVAGLDNLNNAEKTVYMPRTNNGDIMLFTTYLPQINLISEVGDELVDYFVLDGSGDAQKALVIVRLKVSKY